MNTRILGIVKVKDISYPCKTINNNYVCSTDDQIIIVSDIDKKIYIELPSILDYVFSSDSSGEKIKIIVESKTKYPIYILPQVNEWIGGYEKFIVKDKNTVVSLLPISEFNNWVII